MFKNSGKQFDFVNTYSEHEIVRITSAIIAVITATLLVLLTNEFHDLPDHF